MTPHVRVLLLLWGAFLAIWFVSSFGAKKNMPSARAWTGLAIRVVLLVALLIAFRSPGFVEFARRSAVESGGALGTVGVALCAAGIGFAIWARFHLGRNWGMPMSVKQDAELVTTGPYKHVRHPIYTGILLALVGSALVLGAWYAGVVAIFAVYFFFSARSEETVLLEQFGEPYREYMRRTKMLIPFVL
ncbi:MAG TPA: isoprenylcysteine carboxylmethyltransferase family protein [Gammaproteobacteria bacterium]|nr:isoprenylcysteine carboxylmethyltransferase family protein [Gammaproteobacteria bacterium]